MDNIVCLFVFCVIFQAGSAIKCYNCQSSPTNDCKDYPKIPTIFCNATRDSQFTPVCIRRVLKRDSHMETSLLCTDKQSGLECEPPSKDFKVVDCKICNVDLCNGYGRSQPDLNLITASGLFLVVLVAKCF